MLGNKYELEIKYNNESYKLKFTFKFLKNLYSMMNVNPLSYIKDFLNCKDEEMKKYCIPILYSMLDGKIKYKKIIDIANELDNEFMLDMFFLVSIEIKEEDIFDKEEDDSEEEHDENSNEDIKEFIKFWDANYYAAIYQLNMSEEKFLNSSPREIRTLMRLHKNFLKGIILDRDIDIAKAKNKANENYIYNGKVEKVQKVSRMRDLF